MGSRPDVVIGVAAVPPGEPCWQGLWGQETADPLGKRLSAVFVVAVASSQVVQLLGYVRALLGPFTEGICW